MNRPQWSRQRVLKELALAFQNEKYILQSDVQLLGVRGYFQDSMGVVGENDRGIYDDAFFLISPNAFKSYNANTDPTRKGTNKAGRGLAVLQPGIYRYKVGIHGISRPKDKQYPALVQASGVTIKRDGSTVVRPDQWIGLNIHKGGLSTTSSEGCQTVVREQWDDFFEEVKRELKEWRQSEIQYVLIEKQG